MLSRWHLRPTVLDSFLSRSHIVEIYLRFRVSPSTKTITVNWQLSPFYSIYFASQNFKLSISWSNSKLPAYWRYFASDLDQLRGFKDSSICSGVPNDTFFRTQRDTNTTSVSPIVISAAESSACATPYQLMWYHRPISDQWFQINPFPPLHSLYETEKHLTLSGLTDHYHYNRELPRPWPLPLAQVCLPNDPTRGLSFTRFDRNVSAYDVNYTVGI